MPKHFDVIIVGAGPAGCIAALNIAKTNLSVAFLDKASFPRDKICGDAISGNVTFVLNRLESGLLNKFDVFPKKKQEPKAFVFGHWFTKIKLRHR